MLKKFQAWSRGFVEGISILHSQLECPVAEDQVPHVVGRPSEKRRTQGKTQKHTEVNKSPDTSCC